MMSSSQDLGQGSDWAVPELSPELLLQEQVLRLTGPVFREGGTFLRRRDPLRSELKGSSSAA